MVFRSSGKMWSLIGLVRRNLGSIELFVLEVELLLVEEVDCNYMIVWVLDLML